MPQVGVVSSFASVHRTFTHQRMAARHCITPLISECGEKI
jgi:hypothetical protein